MKRDILIYTVGNAISRGCALLTFPIYAKTISAEQMGLQDVAISTAMLAGMCIGLGMENGYARKFHEVDSGERADLATTFAIIVAGIALFCFFFLKYFGEEFSMWVFDASGYATWLICALLIAVLGIFKNIVMLTFRMNAQPYKFVGVAIITALFQVAALFYFVIHKEGQGLGVIQAFLCSAVVSLVVATLLSGWIWKGGFKWAAAKQMLNFGLPLLPAAMATFALVYFARQSLVYTASMEEVATFGIAYRISAMLGLLFFGFQMAWGPSIYREMAQSKESSAKLCGDWTRYLTLFGGLGVAGVGIFSVELITLLADHDKYGLASYSIPLLAMGSLIWALFYIACTGVQYAEKTLFQMVATIIGALITLAVLFVMKDQLNSIISSIATLLGYMTAIVLIVKFSHNFLEVDYSLTRTVPYLLISIAVAYLPYSRIDGWLLQEAVKLLVFLTLIPVGLLLLVKRSELKYLREQVKVYFKQGVRRYTL